MLLSIGIRPCELLPEDYVLRGVSPSKIIIWHMCAACGYAVAI